MIIVYALFLLLRNSKKLGFFLEGKEGVCLSPNLSPQKQKKEFRFLEAKVSPNPRKEKIIVALKIV